MESHSYQNECSTPSENYSDSDEERYNSPIQKTNLKLEDYPASATTESSTDPDESCGSLNYNTNNGSTTAASNFQNIHFHNTNLTDLSQMGAINPFNYKDYSYNYQIHQYLSNTTNYEGYQQGVNTELIQPYSVANFDLINNNTVQQKSISPPSNEHETKQDEKEQDEQEFADEEPVAKTKSNTRMQANSYLMQPPDSESIAAAAVTASINRSKRRTRIKFEKEQLDILEASFQRTHYPDVNIVDRLADLFKISTEKISIWFQNRRARYKKAKKEPNKYEDDYKESPAKDPDSEAMKLTELLQRRKFNEDMMNEANESNSKSSEAKSHQVKVRTSARLAKRNSTGDNYDNDEEATFQPIQRNQQMYAKKEEEKKNFLPLVADRPSPPASSSSSHNSVESRSQSPESFNENESNQAPDMNSAGYAYFQSNMFGNMMPYHHQQLQQQQQQQPLYHEGLNKQMPPTGHFPNIFQPYIDTTNNNSSYLGINQPNQAAPVGYQSNRSSSSSSPSSESRSQSPESSEEQLEVKLEANNYATNVSYPYIQPNMFNSMMQYPPYQHYSPAENLYKQMPGVGGHFSNIFQPYIMDSNNIPSIPNNHLYMPLN